jgi:UDP:flavonoid glycosyltransferase YjiC (YdhE family)
VGLRLATYEFEDAELTAAIDSLLAREALSTRMAELAGRLQASPGTVRAADQVERLMRTGTPVTR